MPERAPVNPSEEAQFPAETEIYILPDGQIVIADLPAELAEALGAMHRLVAQPSSSPTLSSRAATEVATVFDHDAD